LSGARPGRSGRRRRARHQVSINTKAPPDRRSYKVDFSLFRALAPSHIPQLTLAESIGRLRDGLTAMGFADRDFRNSPYIRLKTLDCHLAAGRLAPDLRWAGQENRAAS